MTAGAAKLPVVGAALLRAVRLAGTVVDVEHDGRLWLARVHPIGLLYPTFGTVYLDGVPLSAIGLEAYRAQIGCVLQDDRLFAGSIADNVAGFSPIPDLSRLHEAARLANIHGEI